MKQIQGWTLVVIWIIVAMALLFFHAIWPDTNAWLKEQQHLSGWAQFFGAMIAIGVAYYLGTRQSREARLLVQEQQLVEAGRTFETIRGILDHTRFMLLTFREAWQTNANVVYDLGEWERARTVIGEIDLFKCPAPKLVIYLVQVPKAIGEAILARDHVYRMIDEMVKIGKVEIYDPKKFMQEMNRVKAAEGMLELAIDETLLAESGVNAMRARL